MEPEGSGISYLIPVCLGFLICGLVPAAITVVALVQFVGGLRRRGLPLAPWSFGKLRDLSSNTDNSWSRFGRSLNMKGKILAASDGKTPLVIFSLSLQGRPHDYSGKLTASTSAQSIDYQIEPERITIDVNGSPWGSVGSDGILLNATGQPIGSVTRPGGQPFMALTRSSSLYPAQGANSYPLILGGRTAAEIVFPNKGCLSSLGSLLTSPFSSPREPVVTPADGLSETEANWVLALAVLETVYDNVPARTGGSLTGVP